MMLTAGEDGRLEIVIMQEDQQRGERWPLFIAVEMIDWARYLLNSAFFSSLFFFLFCCFFLFLLGMGMDEQRLEAAGGVGFGFG